MNKKALIEQLRKSLEEELDIQMASEKATRDAATHEESKPENQYDTRALEASYLAGAQSKRIMEMEELVVLYRHTLVKEFGPKDTIANTALINVEFKGKSQYFLLMPKGGGTHIHFEGHRIQVITPSSPVGGALVGLHVGDTALLETGREPLEYEILSIQ